MKQLISASFEADDAVLAEIEMGPSMVDVFKCALQAPDGSFNLDIRGKSLSQSPYVPACKHSRNAINRCFTFEDEESDWIPHLCAAVNGKLDAISIVDCSETVCTFLLEYLLQQRSVFSLKFFSPISESSYHSLALLMRKNMLCGLSLHYMFQSMPPTVEFEDALACTDTLKHLHITCLFFPSSTSSMVFQRIISALERNLSIVECTGGNRPCGFGNGRCAHPLVEELMARNRVEVPRMNALVARQSTTLFDEECPAALAKRIVASKFNVNPRFFDPAGDRCFCKHCHSRRGDAASYRRGTPASKYAVPVGFVRLGILVHPGIALENRIFEDWHVSYHGTASTSIEPIFKSGLKLLMPGDLALGGSPVGIRIGHIRRPFKRMNRASGCEEDFDPCQIFTSPSIRYASHGAFATILNTPHPTEPDVRIGLRFVFQCRQRPGSYTVGQETVGARDLQLDPLFDNNELEWYSKEAPALVLTGLMVQVEAL